MGFTPGLGQKPNVRFTIYEFAKACKTNKSKMLPKFWNYIYVWLNLELSTQIYSVPRA